MEAEQRMKNPNPLYGAIGGDLVGSIYEYYNIKSKVFVLVQSDCELTDDSILTIATAQAILGGIENYAGQYLSWAENILMRDMAEPSRNGCPTIRYTRKYLNRTTAGGTARQCESVLLDSHSIQRKKF